MAVFSSTCPIEYHETFSSAFCKFADITFMYDMDKGKNGNMFLSQIALLSLIFVDIFHSENIKR